MSLPFPRIIERHADEAAFLWERRRRAARSPIFDLASLTQIDLRLDANLEGLVVAGEHGLEACMATVGGSARRPLNAGGELFAALFVAAEIGDTMTLARLLVLAGQHPHGEQAVISALGWLPPGTARRILNELSADECPPALQRLALGGFAARGDDPGAWLARALESSDDRVRARAARSAGELGRRDLVPVLLAEASAGTEASPWALWSLVLFGQRSAVPLLFAVAEAGGAMAERACALAACAADAAECAARLQGLVSRHEWRTALAGAAARGDPGCVPWVLDAIESQPEVARRAAWVYATITGAALEPPLALRVPGEEPGEGAVSRRAADPFEDLPAPQPDAIREHWRGVAAGFAAGERRLGGRRVEQATLLDVLRAGAQPRRQQAAIELARTSAAGGVFPVRAPGYIQSAKLASSSPQAAGA